MSRHHAYDGERNRRHNDKRYRIRAKLRDHQKVNEYKSHGIGKTHVAKRLIGDGPFAVPLHAKITEAIGGTHEALHDLLTARGRLVDLRDQAEHAVQWTVEAAGHVAGDEHHRQ